LTETIRQSEAFCYHPAKHFVMPQEKIDIAIESIEIELEERLHELDQRQNP